MEKAIMKCKVFPGMFSSERVINFEALNNGAGPIEREEIVDEEICHLEGADVTVLWRDKERCLVEFSSQLGMQVVRYLVHQDSLISTCGE